MSKEEKVSGSREAPAASVTQGRVQRHLFHLKLYALSKRDILSLNISPTGNYWLCREIIS